MTKEEVIEILLDMANELQLFPESKQGQAFKMAIKTLEQEPILDKIRAEIKQHRRKTQSIDHYDLVGDCLDIIDKYRGE